MAFKYRYKPVNKQNRNLIATTLVIILVVLAFTIFSTYKPQQPETTTTTTTTATTMLTTTTTVKPISEKGELVIALKDKIQQLENNLGKATSLMLKINSIEIHKSGEDNETGEWIVLSNETKEVDLITHSDVLAEIVDKELDPAKYTQIRLGIEEASVKIYYLEYNIFNKTYSMKVPSNEIKLNHPFTVEKNKLLVLTLDFEVPKSVIRRAASVDNPFGYILTPVIAITEQQFEKGQKPSNLEVV